MSITHPTQQVDTGLEDQICKMIQVAKCFLISFSPSLVRFRYQNTLQDLTLCIFARPLEALFSGTELRSPSSSLMLSLLGYNLVSIASTDLIEIAHDLSVIRLFITAASQRVTVSTLQSL